MSEVYLTIDDVEPGIEVAPAVTLWGLMLEVYAELSRRLEDDLIRATGLNMTWVEVLIRLARTPGQRLRLTQLGDMVSFTSGGISKLVDRMERAGLLARHVDPSDRRATVVSITPSGQVAIRDALEVHVPSLRRHFVGALTPAQADELENVLRTLRAALETERCDPQARRAPLPRR